MFTASNLGAALRRSVRLVTVSSNICGGAFRESDAIFMRDRLDVEVSESVLTELQLVKDEEGAMRLSIRNGLEAFEKMVLAKENRGLSIPVGVNVAQVLARNLNQSGELLMAFARGAIDGSSSAISAQKAEVHL